MAKLVKCEVCGKEYAVSEEKHQLGLDILDALQDIIEDSAKGQEPKYICKNCQKYVGQVKKN